MGGGEAQETSITKNYDTSWVPPLLLLKKLQDGGFIQQNIDEANVGQIVSFDGSLSITDLSMLEPMVPLFGGQDAETVAALEMVTSMPKTVQGHIKKATTNVWFLGPHENWISHPSALILSYGSVIGSGWRIIGLLQSKPSNKNRSAAPNGAGDITKAMIELGEITKSAVGKPNNAYGVTPLLILRPVN